MILTSEQVSDEDLERATGWVIKPEGACRGDICIPLPADAKKEGVVDVRVLAERLSMPLLHDEKHGLFSLGPESGGRALTSAVASNVVLPDLEDKPFELASLRGQKVLLIAWASW